MKMKLLPLLGRLTIKLKPTFVRLIAGLFTLGIYACDALPAPARDAPPNIVFILADDLGFADLGHTGSTSYLTPNIDQLASSGVFFTQAYASHATCLPSRAAILTGKAPARLGITCHDTHLHHDEVTLGDALQEAGYETCFIGKWHVGKHGVAGPREQGFDRVIASNSAGQPASYFAPFGDPTGSKAIFAVPDLESYGPDAFLTECLSTEATKFISASRDRPFFLYLSHYAPHTPLQARPEKIQKFRRRIERGAAQGNAKYAALVEHLDDAVGHVLQSLAENGLADNTVVVFFSDNGGDLRDRITSNAPLRGGKRMHYEGGIRVPMIVRWPGVTPAGTTCNVPVIGHDLFPTLLAMAGSDQADEQQETIDGVDVGPLLRDPSSTLERTELHWLRYPMAVHYRPNETGAGPGGALRAGDWKLIEFLPTTRGAQSRYELYNLRTDPGEKHDLASSEPERLEALKQTIERWRTRVDAPAYDRENYIKLQ